MRGLRWIFPVILMVLGLIFYSLQPKDYSTVVLASNRPTHLDTVLPPVRLSDTPLNIDEFYNKMLRESPHAKDVQGLLWLDHSGEEVLPSAKNTKNATEIILLLNWISAAGGDAGNRCLYARSLPQNDVVVADCKVMPPESPRWHVLPSGHLGFHGPHNTQLCLTAPAVLPDVSQPLTHGMMLARSARMTRCTAQNKNQQWDFVVDRGLVNRQTGQCLTAQDINMPVMMRPCGRPEYLRKQRYMRVDDRLVPHQWRAWVEAMAKRRSEQLAHHRQLVTNALHDIQELKDKPPALPAVRRRAAVFYIDPDSTGQRAQVLWWIYAWNATGLNEPEQGFDILLFGDEQQLAEAGYDCVRVDLKDPRSFKAPRSATPGRVRCIPYRGISKRNAGYDPWMNRLDGL